MQRQREIKRCITSAEAAEKVIHSAECYHIQNIAIENVNSFETISDTYQSRSTALSKSHKET